MLRSFRILSSVATADVAPRGWHYILHKKDDNPISGAKYIEPHTILSSNTPLHLALLKGDTDKAKSLVKSISDIWTKNPSEYSAIEIAFQTHNWEFLNAVRDEFGDSIEKHPFEGVIERIATVDPEVSELTGVLADFYHF